MADQVPVKAKFTGPNPTALGEFEATDTVGINNGGTGADNASQALTNLDGVSTTTFNNHANDTNNPHGVTAAQAGAIPDSEKGVANGVATLDGGGKVLASQIPAVSLPEVKVVANAAARLVLVVQEGDEAIQLDDGSHWIYDGITWYPRPAGGPIFGTEFQYAESLPVSTTTSTSFQNKLTLTTTNLPFGTYRLEWSFGWNHNSSEADFEARLQDNNFNVGEIHKQEPKDAAGSFGSTGTSQRYYATRVRYLVLSGVHTFDLDYRTDNSERASSIWEASISLWRVQ